MANRTIEFLLLAKDKASQAIDHVGRSAQDAGKHLGSMGATAGKALGAVAVIAGGVAAKGIWSATQAASDLNETVSKSKTVFGESFAAVDKFSQSAATTMGMSRQAALDAAGSMGAYYKQIGLTSAQVAKFSTENLKLASDLASFNNVDTSTALEAMSSALVGEYDPIQKLIPGLTAATVQTEALALSHKKKASALTEADKQMALHSLMLKNSTVAQGDFAKTSDGLANSQRTLSAMWQDAKASLGQAFLPAAVAVANFLKDNLPQAIQTLKGAWNSVKAAFEGAGNSGFIQKLLPILKDVGAQIKDVAGPAFAKIGQIVSTQVVPALKAFGKAMEPILIFLAQKLGPVVVNTFKTVLTVIQGALKVIAGIFNTIAGVLTGDWSRAWNGIKQIVSGAWQIIKGLVTGGIAQVKAILSAVGPALKAIGSRILDGLLDGARAGWAKVEKFFKSLTDKIPDWKGPRAKDKVLLKPAGQAIMDGLLSGFKAVEPQVARYLEAFTDRIANIKITEKTRGKISQLVNSIGDTLAKQTASLNAVKGRIDDQKKALEDLISTRADYAEKLASGVNGGGLTSIKLAEDVTDANGNVTKADKVASFIDSLKQRSNAITGFNADLAKLQAMGASQDTLQQLAAAGIDTGGAIAAALAQGTPEAIAQIEALNKQIKTQSDTFGNTWAGSMYDAGVNAAQGLLKGLQSQQATLERQIDALAQTLMNRMSAALGVSAPQLPGTVTPITAARSATVINNNITVQPGIISTAADVARQLERTIQQASQQGVKVNLKSA